MARNSLVSIPVDVAVPVSLAILDRPVPLSVCVGVLLEVDDRVGFRLQDLSRVLVDVVNLERLEYLCLSLSLFRRSHLCSECDGVLNDLDFGLCFLSLLPLLLVFQVDDLDFSLS